MAHRRYQLKTHRFLGVFMLRAFLEPWGNIVPALYGKTGDGFQDEQASPRWDVADTNGSQRMLSRDRKEGVRGSNPSLKGPERVHLRKGRSAANIF
jgi:hypothetical protein